MADSSILHNFPQWEKINKDLEDDPFSDSLWNDLVSHHEKLIADHKELLKSRRELKTLLYSDMDRLLTKFPYYAIYWKRYVTMVYTLEGLKPSINILTRAVFQFPYSLEIWVDYVNILVTNKIKTDEEMAEIFRKGAGFVGFHFLGHQFWDIYLDWAKNVYGVNSNDYIRIFIKIVKLPLYQYAKFNEDFINLRKNFHVLDLIEKNQLVDYIKQKKYNDGKIEDFDDFIEENSNSLIEDYFNDILIDVQARVQDKWKYESSIKVDFDLKLVTINELNEWISYIEYEENYIKIKNKNQISINDEIISLYERSLVSTCLSDQMWIRYARYLIQNNGNNDQIVSVFNRACDHFVPLELKDIRYMYIKYLELKVGKLEECKVIFLSMITNLPTESEIVSKFVDFLINYESAQEKDNLIKDVLNCVHRYNKENSTHKNTDKRKKINGLNNNISSQNLEIKSQDINELYKRLNFWTIGQLIVNICKYYWFIKKDIKLTRDTLMSFFNTASVKSNKSYWYFFFKFEVCQRNKKNLTNIIESVRVYSTLNVSDINFLIDEYVSFVFKNFTVTELKQNERDIIKNFLETDFESSMHMKHFLKTRLAEDNNEDTVNRKLVRENGHPAATCEGRPTLINPLPLYDNTFNVEGAHPLPRFRNVEKASLNVKYIHESL